VQSLVKHFLSRSAAIYERLDRAWWVFLFVPLVYFALIVWLQPPSRLGPSQRAPWLGRLLYDDYDMTAYALRGLNASLGRTAGRLDQPEAVGKAEFNNSLHARAPTAPSESPYFLEYPHACLLLFRLGFAFGPGAERQGIPAVIQDADYHDLVEHTPRDNFEKAIWRQLRLATRIYAALGAICLLGLMFVLRTGYEPGGGLSGPVILAVLPATLYFSLQRFDIVPALLTALGFTCLGRRRVIASAVFMAAATMVKLYPVVLVALLVRYLAAERKAMWTWMITYALTLAAFLLPSLFLSGPAAVWAPLAFQLKREPEDWTLYGYILPTFLAAGWWGGLFRAGSLLLVLGCLLWRRPRDLAGMLRCGAIVLLVFVALQVFYSPQWIVWLTPLLIPLAGRRRSIFWSVVALDLTTFLTFPLAFDMADIPAKSCSKVALIGARFGVISFLAVSLWYAEFRRSAKTTEPASPDCQEDLLLPE